MNFFDLLFIIILIISILFSLKNGFFKELLSSMGILGGFFLAEQYHLEYSDRIKPFISPPELAESATYAGIFITFIFIIFILSHIISLMIRRGKVSGISRVVALAFGTIKGVAICLFIFSVVTQFIPSFVDDLEGSRFSPLLQQLQAYLSGLNIA